MTSILSESNALAESDSQDIVVKEVGPIWLRKNFKTRGRKVKTDALGRRSTTSILRLRYFRNALKYRRTVKVDHERITNRHNLDGLSKIDHFFLPTLCRQNRCSLNVKAV
jgi:hypothetical protein